MTSKAIIHEQREENLGGFEEALGQLDGVGPEVFDALRRSSTTTPGRGRFPRYDDLVGLAAYQAAALRGLAESLLNIQEANAGSSARRRAKADSK